MSQNQPRHEPNRPLADSSPLTVLVTAALLSMLAMVVLSPAAIAQAPGQMIGIIFDENEQPIEGVKIIITDPERPNFHQEETSDSRGRYRIRLTNAVPPYNFTFSKDGYVTFSISKFRVPATSKPTRRNFTLNSVSSSAGAAELSGSEEEVDLEAAARGSATKVYNEGVKALNSGDASAAKDLFLTALDRDASMPQAMAALARAYLELEQYEDAASWAEKAVAADQELESMNQVLYASYTALGQEDKAQAALDQLKEADPEKASLNMYNEAADLFNAGELDKAQAAFEAILKTNPDHGKSHYMLGLCYVNSGNNAKAKEHFTRFMELSPDDPDAATAAEMVKYLE